MLKIQRAGHGKDYWWFSMFWEKWQCTRGGAGFHCEMVAEGIEHPSVIPWGVAPPPLPVMKIGDRTVDGMGTYILSERHFGQHKMFVTDKRWTLR